MVLVDRQEAFDPQWRPSMLLPLAKLVPPRLWCVMDELLKNTSMDIVSGCNRSSPFTTKVIAVGVESWILFRESVWMHE